MEDSIVCAYVSLLVGCVVDGNMVGTPSLKTALGTVKI